MNYRWCLLLLVLISLGCDEGVNQQLFDKYYSPFEVQLNPDAEVRHLELDTAFQAYQEGDYETVERITTYFMEEYYSVPQVMFAQSIAFLELHKDDEAISNFKTLAMHPYFGPQANWYAALVEVRRGDNTAAIEFLKEVVKRVDAAEKRDAEILIKELENLY